MTADARSAQGGRSGGGSVPVGSVIGAIAGLVFVLANAGELDGAPVLRATGLVGSAAVVFVLLSGPRVDQPAPSRSAMRVYWVCVAGELAAIPLGAAVSGGALHTPSAVVAWVVFVVGAHFGPFARVFGMPLFAWLAGTLVPLGAVGLVLALTVDGRFAAASAVVAGYVLLAFSAAGPYLSGFTPRARPTRAGGSRQ
jgi:hypothetical protein